MIKHEVTYNGIIEFEIENKTKKHELQASWKRSVMVLFEGEICEYYQWFINRRYSLPLKKPLRRMHCSLINDRFTDVKGETLEDKEKLWNEVKNKYNGQSIDVTLNLDMQIVKNYWFFDLNEQSKLDLQAIRQELGLGLPYYDFHCTVGIVNEINKPHHDYIKRLLDKGLIS